MRWFQNAPPGRIARSIVLVAYVLAIVLQRQIDISSFWVGLGFLAVSVASGLWKKPLTLPGWAALAFCVSIFTVSLLSEPPLMSQLGVGALVFLISAFGILQREKSIVQYLFLCRFPALIALLFVGLPWLATTETAAPMVGNLFVLSPVGLLIVSTLAVLTSWVLMITSRLILSHAHTCHGVTAWQVPLPRWALWKGDQMRPPESLLWLCTLPALPIIGLAVARSRHPEIAWYWQLAMVVLGVLAARVVFYVGRRLSEQVVAPGAQPGIGRAHRASIAEWLRGDESLPSHRLLAGFLLATFLLYVGGYFLLHPEGAFHWHGFGYLAFMTLFVGALIPRWPVLVGLGIVDGAYLAVWLGTEQPRVLEVPALAYVLVLTILVGWLFALVSFYLDHHRVPALPVLFALPLLLYFIVDLDHYYHLIRHEPVPELTARESFGATGLRLTRSGGEPSAEEGSRITRAEEREILRAMSARRDHFEREHPGEEPVMVFVAASGGGITASLWTAHVLSTLAEECPRVVDGMHLISAVSGGGVGAMYFLDAYERGVLDSEIAIRNAGTSSLSASAWGLAYPDFWRSFSLRHPWDRMMDRAWAMEKAWERTLDREDIPTLADWGSKARSGEMPVLLFNATVSETGDRFLMPTLNLRSIRCAPDEEGCVDRSHTLATLYANHSLSVVTAARLSATFPFVSPIARAWIQPDTGMDFHIADGGYYDNFGVMSLVEWLIELFEHQNPAKVLILEIRASSQEMERKARRRAGWLYASAGPLTTMLQVRTSSQIARNDLDLELIQRIGGERFSVERVLFPLELANPPISWHLSERQKKDILDDDLSGKLDELRAKLPGICPVEGEVEMAALGRFGE